MRPKLTHIRDINALDGQWPIHMKRYSDLAELDQAYRACGIEEVWISAVEAVLAPDPVLAEQPLLKQLESFSRFYPVKTLNPKLPGRIHQALKEAKVSDRVPVAYKVFPNYHGYSADGPEIEAAAEVAIVARRPLLIQIRLNDERNQPEALQVGPTNTAAIARLARRHPELSIIALSAFANELPTLLDGGPNLFADIALVDSDDPLTTACQSFEAKRLCFGSMAGLAYPEAAVLKLQWTDTPEAIVAGIAERHP